MDFFDEAVGKAKDFFAVAYKKTGEAVNTGKQKFDIASLENKLSKEYETLGRLYYNSVKNGEEPDAEVSINEIDILNELIEQKRQEILKNTSKQICSKCGKITVLTDAFCPACGERLKKESEE